MQKSPESAVKSWIELLILVAVGVYIVAFVTWNADNAVTVRYWGTAPPERDPASLRRRTHLHRRRGGVVAPRAHPFAAAEPRAAPREEAPARAPGGGGAPSEPARRAAVLRRSQRSAPSALKRQRPDLPPGAGATAGWFSDSICAFVSFRLALIRAASTDRCRLDRSAALLPSPAGASPTH